MKIKVLTNFANLKSAGYTDFDLIVRSFHARPGSVLNAISLFFESRRFDYILLNNGSSRILFVLALLRALFPFGGAKIVAVDLLLSSPKNRRAEVKTAFIKLVLRRVHLILLYYKNTAGLEERFSIDKSKLRYIPFKVNHIDYIKSLQTSDRGYVFCGGKTRRDFETLFEAVSHTSIPILLVTTVNEDIAQHGSFLDAGKAPANVEIVITDGGHEAFIDLMANARMVVQPIVPDVCGAGLGVNLMAMALRKCLVVSSGPGVEDTIPKDAAIVFKAQDPAALKSAILQVYNDAQLRSATADAGFEYASRLGGEPELLHSIAMELYRDAQQCSKTLVK